MSEDLPAPRRLVVAHVVKSGTQHRSELLATSPGADTHQGSTSRTHSNCDGRETPTEELSS
jgi:hypothetical protein